MQSPSALSRAALVGELLAAPEHPCAATAVECREPMALAAVLDRKLGIARELLLRDLHDQMHVGPVMESPHAMRDWLRLRFQGLQHEVFLVMFLSAQHHLIEAAELFRGTLTQTSVYPREIVKAALARNAAAVAFAHNHPPGVAEPSRADEFLTQTLKSALALVDVRVLDHFVVAGDQAVSFAERDLL